MSMEKNGLRIVLSPVQLAAILSNASVSEGEIVSNRIWGGVGLLGGMLEMFGAGVLCVVPEPTMTTKVGCVVVGAHGADVVHSSIKQIMTGQRTQSYTHEKVSELAEQMGAEAGFANKIGLVVDLAVPMGLVVPLGASKIKSIFAGEIELYGTHSTVWYRTRDNSLYCQTNGPIKTTLTEMESLTGLKPGGHTIERHVRLSHKQLLDRSERFMMYPSGKRPEAVSSFFNKLVAQKAISQTIKANKLVIEQWVRNGNAAGRIKIEHKLRFTVGKCLILGTTNTIRTSSVRIVLLKESFNNKPYYVLTAFPIL